MFSKVKEGGGGIIDWMWLQEKGLKKKMSEFIPKR